MKKIKSIIVEDSRLARAELKELLKNHTEIEIIAEAENVDQALKLIKEQQPILIFLDINMPGKNGFDLLEMLDAIPIVIFTTAYDEFAIKSFEYNAFDYLLKPIDKDRFAKTINRLIPLLNEKNKEPILDTNLNQNSQIFIKEDQKCWMIYLKEIILFEIMGNYTRVYFDDQKPLIYKSLNQIEEKLPTDFFRINRQQIINLKKIKKVTPWFNDRLKIMLKNNIEVESSRRQTLKFKNKLAL